MGHAHQVAYNQNEGVMLRRFSAEASRVQRRAIQEFATQYGSWLWRIVTDY
jgi:hypothetical protein